MGRAPVDVWLLVPPLDPPPLTWLDDVERRRAAALAPGPAARFIAGRHLLRAVLGDRFGLAPGEVRLVARCIRCGGPHGQVRVGWTEEGSGGAPPCHVSISRSGPLVAVATADAPVGVDVESVEAVGAAQLADVALSADERARHTGLPHDESPVDLARTWAGKEAVLKALGTGLDVDPSSFTLTYPATTVGGLATTVGLPASAGPGGGPDRTADSRPRETATVAVADLALETGRRGGLARLRGAAPRGSAPGGGAVPWGGSEPWNGPGGGVVGAVAMAGASSLALRVHDGGAALSRAGAGLLQLGGVRQQGRLPFRG